MSNDATSTAADLAAPPPAPTAPKTAFVGTADRRPLARPATPAAPATGDEAQGEETEQADAPTRPTVDDLGGEESRVLKDRLERAKAKARAELLSELGIEDPNKFKTERELQSKELERFKKEEEKRKRAQMTETQRMSADLEAQRTENAQLKARIEELEETHLAEQQNNVIDGIARRHVKEKFLKFARRELLEHVNRLDEEARESFGEEETEAFIAQLVKDTPEFAVGKDEKPKEKTVVQRPAGVPRPLANASGTPRPSTEATVAATGGKTAKPGRPNSMSTAEVRAQAQKKGFSWPA